MLHLKLVLEYPDAKTAKTILDSVLPDNGKHVASVLEGNKITFTMEADNAGTLRNTADDLLACVKIAEEASGLVSGSVSDLDGDPFLE